MDQGNSLRQAALARTWLCGTTLARVVVTLQMDQMTCPTAAPLPRLESQGRSTMPLSQNLISVVGVSLRGVLRGGRQDHLAWQTMQPWVRLLGCLGEQRVP